jgi:hypothetical protein
MTNIFVQEGRDERALEEYILRKVALDPYSLFLEQMEVIP